MELFSTLESTIIPSVILVTVLIAHNVPEFVKEGGSRRVSRWPSLKWQPYWILKMATMSHIVQDLKFF